MIKTLEYMALGKPIAAFDLVETRVSAGDAAVYADGRPSPRTWPTPSVRCSTTRTCGPASPPADAPGSSRA